MKGESLLKSYQLSDFILSKRGLHKLNESDTTPPLKMRSLVQYTKLRAKQGLMLGSRWRNLTLQPHSYVDLVMALWAI